MRVEEPGVGRTARLAPWLVAWRALARAAVRLLLPVAGLAGWSVAVASAAQPTLQSGVFGDERLLLGVDPPATPHGGHVRTGDPYPLPSAVDKPGPALPCMTMKDAAFEQLSDCARPNPDGSYTVARDALRQLDFDRWGLATLAIREQGYAHVRRDGRALVVPTFDNAPDEFIGGLVRVRIGDKLGYANRRLKLVIPARYDGAYRFAGNGRARACIDCVSVSDGEHSFYRGGTSVCLDRRGRQRPAGECGQGGWLPPQLRE